MTGVVGAAFDERAVAAVADVDATAAGAVSGLLPAAMVVMVSLELAAAGQSDSEPRAAADHARVKEARPTSRAEMKRVEQKTNGDAADADATGAALEARD